MGATALRRLIRASAGPANTTLVREVQAGRAMLAE
jgi:hypothetical protein